MLSAELAADREAGERLAGELRACAAAENEVQAALKERGEAVTRGEVRAQQERDRAAEAERELQAAGDEARPRGDARRRARCPRQQRAQLADRIERLRRRREQLGPVNPLAQREYEEALAHVEELERQREDLEAAMRELEGLIRDTDRRIREAFEETFAAAASNFEEVVEQLFPGGRGRLRLVKEDAGPRPVLGGAEPPEAEEEPEPEEDDEGPEDDMGVEIEITPAGKSTKRLTLLSGGEKSLDGAGVPVRRLPRPAVPVLHPRRGRGRARRPQHRPLPRPAAPVRGPGAVHRRHPPEAHDGGGRLSLRRLDGGRRRVEGGLAPAARGAGGAGGLSPVARLGRR